LKTAALPRALGKFSVQPGTVASALEQRGLTERGIIGGAWLEARASEEPRAAAAALEAPATTASGEEASAEPEHAYAADISAADDAAALVAAPLASLGVKRADAEEEKVFAALPDPLIVRTPSVVEAASTEDEPSSLLTSLPLPRKSLPLEAPAVAISSSGGDAQVGIGLEDAEANMVDENIAGDADIKVDDEAAVEDSAFAARDDDRVAPQAADTALHSKLLHRLVPDANDIEQEGWPGKASPLFESNQTGDGVGCAAEDAQR
jgi:hypothetical protein